MAKAQEKDPQEKAAEPLAKPEKDKKQKDKDKDKDKDHKALVGRVKKVVKKSRRKLSEEKFEKELQRTIAFLEQLQGKIAHPAEAAAPETATVSGKASKSAAKRAPKKAAKRASAKTAGAKRKKKVAAKKKSEA